VDHRGPGQRRESSGLADAAGGATITKARPLIAGFSNNVETVPIGGYGLLKAAG
jgi:hypothetical protein